MEPLTPEERHFFSLVHPAVYANPFSERRARVDREIAGMYPNRRTAKKHLEVKERLFAAEEGMT